MKTYSELIGLPTIEERFLYLQEGIAHSVGDQTFGSLRYTNQALYRSRFWKEEVRPAIIARDNGCDIAMPGFIIPHPSLIRVHHINPLTPESFDDEDPMAYDPENLVCMHAHTHQLLTYGGKLSQEDYHIIERKPNDHILWKKVF